MPAIYLPKVNDILLFARLFSWTDLLRLFPGIFFPKAGNHQTRATEKRYKGRALFTLVTLGVFKNILAAMALMLHVIS